VARAESLDESAIDASLDDLGRALEPLPPPAIDWRPRAEWLPLARANGGSITCADRALRRCTYSPHHCFDGCENFPIHEFVPLSPPREIVQRNPDVVRDMVRRQRPRLRGCYQRALIGDPTAAGIVTIAVAIDSEGVVRAAIVDSTTTSVALSECALFALSRLEFAPIDGAPTLVLRFPFRFALDDGELVADGPTYTTSYTRRGLQPL
jgi:hypothetical protein